jgi:thiol peroxidase
MGRSPEQLLPLASSEYPLWSAAALFALGFTALVVFGVLLAEAPGRIETPLAILLPIGVVAILNAGIVLVERYVNKRARLRWQRRAFALGLVEYRERVAKADVDALRDLPLFRFGEPWAEKGCCLASGVLEGRSVSVLHYHHAASYPSRQGALAFCCTALTVAFFPDVDLPDFHLTTHPCTWDSLRPGWPRLLGVGRVIRVVNGYSAEPILIRGEDEAAVAGLFSQERIAQLGELAGWTIECRAGRLLVYRHKEVMDAEALPAFVHRALDLVAVLTSGTAEPLLKAAAWTPVSAIQPDRQGRSITALLDADHLRAYPDTVAISLKHPTVVEEPTVLKRPNATTLKGAGLTLLGPQLKVGDKAPDFTCATGLKDTLTLAQTPAKARLFSVVPSLDTPVCSMQTKKFNEKLASLKDKAACYTISLDLPFAQGRFCGAEGITNMQTLSDTHNHSFGQAYGVLIEGLAVPLLSRAIFVVDGAGTIRHVEYVPEIATEPNYDAALAALQAVAR